MCDNHLTHDLNKAYSALITADVLVEKAFMLSEIASIARAEIRLRKFIEGHWDVRKKQAITKAVSMATQKQAHGRIAKEVDRIMNLWSSDVLPHYNFEMARVYKLARVAGYKKASGDTTASLQFNTPKITSEVKKAKTSAAPKFDLVDKQAIEALEGKNTFWVGEHYGANVSATVAEVTKDVMIASGGSSKVAGEKIKEVLGKALGIFSTPSGYHGTQANYFEGLVANAMTVGRVYGQMRSFSQIGITKYTIVNPGGDRICEVCLALQGTTFTTQQAIDQISKEYGAKKPDDIKAIHPWPKNTNDIVGKSSAELAAAGLSLPPYHFRCRCTTDVSTEIETYEQLVPLEFPIPKN